MGNKTAFSIQHSVFSIKQLSFILFCAGYWLLTTDYCSFAAEKKEDRVPTVITSRTLNADNKARTALFEGNVVAKKGDMTMFADRMLVFYAEEKGGSNIKKIEAEGNVKLVKGDRVVTSALAVYFVEPEEHIVFTGEPRATEGENVVTGTKMTNYIKDDRSVVENSKVFLVEKKRRGDSR